MGFWPFGGSKKSRLSEKEESGNTSSTTWEQDDMARLEKARQTSASRSGPTRSTSRREDDKQPRRLSKTRAQVQDESTLSGRSHNQLMSASRDAALQRNHSSARPSRSDGQGNVYHHSTMSQSSMGPETFSALPHPPTLHAKRSDHEPNIPRRKSSKRKADDYAREREVRAMSSSPIPVSKRPATYSGSGSLRRDAKQVPGDLNRRLTRPTSEISLPTPESVSELDEPPVQHSFKIGVLAALTPRPTVRYDNNPRYSHGKQLARTKVSINQAIAEEDFSPRKRIDNLADDLDAGGLRELMERDRKRRERKKELDQAKLQRKLQKRAEQQREEEARQALAQDTTTSSPSQPITGTEVEARSSLISVSVEPESSISTAPFIEKLDNNSLKDHEGRGTVQRPGIRNPFEDEQEADIMQDPFAHEDDQEEVVPVKSPVRRVGAVELPREAQASQAALSPPISPVQRPVDRHSSSQPSVLGRELTLDIPEDGEPGRRASDNSSTQVNSWRTFFKRGDRRKPGYADRGKTTPSEFSNTSRESFRKQPPPVVIPRTFRKPDSGIPQRTMSKFREDLPEFPISPPDSRVQSPETAPAHHAATLPPPQSAAEAISQLPFGPINSTLDRGQQESRLSSNRSMDMDMAGVGSSALVMSQSLASVDSEASWLSGKVMQRSSGPLDHPLRQSEPSLQPRVAGAFQPDDEDLINDEYLSRLAPAAEDRRASLVSVGRKPSSTIIDLQREREQSPVPDLPEMPDRVDETWHGSVGRQATIVRQTSRAKSKEGLLKEYLGEASPGSSSTESVGEGLDPETPGAELQDAPILRARSVDYKGHARRISAGSARLLNIRRSSVHSESLKGSSISSPTAMARSSGLFQHEDNETYVPASKI